MSTRRGMKKGFTLIEILVTIALLALISAVVIFSVVKVQENQKEQEYNNLIGRIKSGASTYTEMNNELKQKIYATGESQYILIEDLINAGLIDEKDIIDPKDNKKVTEKEDENERRVRVYLNHQSALEYEYPSDQDKEAPNCKITAVRDTTNKKVTLTVSSEDKDLSQKPYSWESATSGFGLVQETSKTKNGTYRAYIKDTSGNVGRCSIKIGSDLTDFIAPTCEYTGESTEWATSRTISYGCKDTGGSGCVTEAKSVGWVYTTKTSVINEYTIKDKAGNTTTCKEKTVNVYVDSEKPECVYPTDATSWATSRKISYGCKDSGGSECATATVEKTITDSRWTWPLEKYTIKDKAGNSTTCDRKDVAVLVDVTKPTGKVAFTTNYNNNGQVTIGLTASELNDTHSGVARWSINYMVGNEIVTINSESSWSKTYGSELSGKTITAILTVTDDVGNQYTTNISQTLKTYGANGPVCGYIEKQSENCGCQTYNSCPDVRCGCQTYNSCPNEQVCGCETYNSCSACDCQTYNYYSPSCEGAYAQQNVCADCCGSYGVKSWNPSIGGCVCNSKKTTCKVYKACASCGCQTASSCPNSSCTCAAYNSCPNDSCSCAVYNFCAHENHGSKSCWY